ncbi:MAG: M23 family metallopeptidase [Bacteroidota bacterium]
MFFKKSLDYNLFRHLNETKGSLFCVLLIVIQLFKLFESNGQSLDFRLIDGEHRIAGTFGEFRGSHFHSGIDLKTGGREGIPVFAVADGYVSRVLISRNGYGKALYINHQNNLTTVYAHLRAFSPPLENLIRPKQLAKQSFETEFYPDKGSVPIKKGEIIGYVGNTGSSEGPHLHFETRHTDKEKPFDPSLLGFKFKDTIPPRLESLLVYDLPNEKLDYPLESPRVFNSEKIDTISVGDYSLLGLNFYDLAGNETNRLGIKTVELKVNGKTKFQFQLSDFKFNQSRYISGILDQGMRNMGIESFLCHKPPRLELPFYTSGKHLGILHLPKDSLLNCEITLGDINGNTTSKKFTLINNSQNQQSTESLKEACKLLSPDEEQLFDIGNMQFILEKNSLLDSSCIWLDSSYTDHQIISHILPNSVPLLKPMKIMVEHKSLNLKNSNKVIIAKRDQENNWTSLSTKSDQGWLSASSNTMGEFTLIEDVVSPTCSSPKYFKDDFTRKTALSLILKDNLSGIGDFTCTINHKWVPAEFYPSRNELIIYNIDKYTGQTLKIVAKDKCGNMLVEKMKIEF